MSAEVEILGVQTTADEEFIQPKEEAIDLSQYSEAAIMATLFEFTRNGGTTTITLQTAVDNQDDRYVDLAELASITGDPSTPYTRYIYLAGPGAAGADQPGFARFMRVKITQAAGASIALDVKAILKP